MPGEGEPAGDLGGGAAQHQRGFLVGEGEVVDKEQDAAGAAGERRVRGKGAGAAQNGAQDVDFERLNISAVLRIGIVDRRLGHTRGGGLIAEEAEGEGVSLVLQEEDVLVEGGERGGHGYRIARRLSQGRGRVLRDGDRGEGKGARVENGEWRVVKFRVSRDRPGRRMLHPYAGDDSEGKPVDCKSSEDIVN